MSSCRCRRRDIAWRIGAAAGVSAQTIYKQVDAAGRITFTDRPDTTPTPGAATVPVSDVADALARNAAISSRRGAMIDANEATRRLEQAQAERKHGADRQPGGQPHGIDASMADDRYWRRQEQLQRAVEQAERRSSETGRALRAHR
jgi:hypothetical protein